MFQFLSWVPEVTFLQIVTFVVIVASWIYWQLTKNYGVWEARGLPSIKPSLFFGNLKPVYMGQESVMTRFVDVYNELKDHRVAVFYNCAEAQIMLRDPELVKAVFIKDFDHFPDMAFLEDYLFTLEGNNFGFANETGEKWKKLKGLLTPLFSLKKLRDRTHEINMAAKETVEEIAKNVSGGSIVIDDYVKAYTMNCIGKTALGINPDAHNNKETDFYKFGTNMFGGIWRFLLADFMPSLMYWLNIGVLNPKGLKYLRKVVKELLNEDIPESSTSIISTLLRTRKEHPDGHLITDEFLVGTLVQFLSDGNQTVSGNMMLALYFLSMNPEVQDRALDEVDNLGDDVTEEEVNELKYMEQIFTETMRFSCFHATFRRCKKPWKIPGTDIVVPKGVRINIPVLGFHMDPKYFENPTQFDPDRFSPERRSKIPSCAYIPFGDGPRACIGMRIARFETKLLLFHILKRFRLEPGDGMPRKLTKDVWDLMAAVPSIAGGVRIKLICTGSDDATVRLWSNLNGEFIASINRHDLRVLDLAFVPESEAVVSMSADALFLWQMPSMLEHGTGLKEYVRTKRSDFSCMALSNGGDKLVAGTVDMMITIWDVDTAAVLLILPGHHDHIYVLNFTQDDLFLLSGAADETVMIWTMESLDEPTDTSGRSGSVCLGPAFDVKFLNDDCRLVAPDESNAIQTVVNGKFLNTNAPPETTGVTVIEMSVDGNVVFYGCRNGAVRSFRPFEGFVRNLGTHESCVNDISLSADCNILVSVSEDRTVKIWLDGDGSIQCLTCLDGHDRPVHFSFMVCNDSRVLTCCEEGTLVLWDAATAKKVKEARRPSRSESHATSVDVTDTLIGVACVDGTVTLYAMATLEKQMVLERSGSGPARICRFSPDSRIIVVGYDSQVMEFSAARSRPKKRSSACDLQVWSVLSGRRMSSPLKLHQTWVTDIRFSSDSRRMVSVGDKIAWWSLDLAPKRKLSSTASYRKSTTTLFGRRKPSSEGTMEEVPIGELGMCTQSSPNFTAKTPAIKSPSFTIPSPTEKVGFHTLPALLQLFDIKGSSLTRIFTSPNFQQFITIDDAGIVYILEEIEQSSSLDLSSRRKSSAPLLKVFQIQ